MFPKVSIKDYSDDKKLTTFQEFFTPKLAEVGFLALVSFFIILLFNIDTIWKALRGASIEYLPTTGEAVSGTVGGFNQFILSEALGQATSFVVWGIVGSVIYTGVWIIQHFYFRVRRDVEESEYDHVEQGVSYWESRVAQFAILVAASITFFGAIISLFYIIPLMSTLGEAVLANPMQFVSYIFLAIGVGIGVVTLYLLVRIWHVLHYAFNSYFDSSES